MNMVFKRKLPVPSEIKEMYPISDEGIKTKEAMDESIKMVLDGRSDKFLLIIGPCSADKEESVMDYMMRLSAIRKEVDDVLVLVPRVYTNKPRTTGMGYKGMLHQPDPLGGPDLLKGLIAIRKLHMRVVNEAGFSGADEMLYPENHRYLSDLLSYVAVGARSVENQFNRLTASGVDIPVGFKNPTSGDLNVLMNSIRAAQSPHHFIYRNWEVESTGNPYSHVILRGYTDSQGNVHPNYHYEDLKKVALLYRGSGLANPAIIVDCNHDNSGKNYLEQRRIAKEVLHSMKHDPEINHLVKGLMVESYLVDGKQNACDGVYGQSITDPCLGWEKSEALIKEIAEILRQRKTGCFID